MGCGKAPGRGGQETGWEFLQVSEGAESKRGPTHETVVRACGFWVVMPLVNYRLSTDVCPLNE